MKKPMIGEREWEIGVEEERGIFVTVKTELYFKYGQR